MEDEKIVALYWARAENAIAETSAKYGSYCHTIARNILGNTQDAEESVNDTWLDAWHSMPPQRPSLLGAFLGAITRRLSIDKWRRRSAQKRGGGQTELALEELSECVPAGSDTAQSAEANLLAAVLEDFLAGLPETERRVFLCRYWYLDPVAEIARRFSFSESKVKSMLYRTRARLRARLEKEGF